MNEEELLLRYKNGEIELCEVLKELKKQPFSQDLGFANIDLHRKIRNGCNEVVYGAGKTPQQILDIASAMIDRGIKSILVTRVPTDTYDFLKDKIAVDYHPFSGIAVIGEPIRSDVSCGGVGKIIIVSAGTSDIKVCEEAALTAAFLGSNVECIFDVGVAGLHRLLARLDTLYSANVLIVVAGMEGALASVVGGLVDCPIVAVPTSVGYGANFNGLSALLSMLNSCASGVGVVNIDNGFGAGYLAHNINKRTI